MEVTAYYDGSDTLIVPETRLGMVEGTWLVRLATVPEPSTLDVRIRRESPTTVLFASESKQMRVKAEESRDWDNLLPSNLGMLLDAAVTLFADLCSEDILCVQPMGGNKVWLFTATASECDYNAVILTRDVPNLFAPRVFYNKGFGAFHTEPDDRLARQLFEFMGQADGLNLPSDFPLLQESSSSHKRSLTVKLGPGAEWVLLFPFNYFRSRPQLGRFSNYSHVEWIVTPKSLMRNSHERRRIHAELSDVASVLRHSFFIFNEYGHFSDASQRDLWVLLEEVLHLLSDINVAGAGGNVESLSLHWRRNPTPDELCSILCNQRFRYIFADFHVEGGRWRVPLLDGSDECFDLSRFTRGDFRHIRLLRVFHCNSVLNTYEPWSTSPSIVRQLLDLGALRVEGSTHREQYTDFLEHSLATLVGGLKPIVYAACLKRGVLPESLGDRLRRYDIVW